MSEPWLRVEASFLLSTIGLVLEPALRVDSKGKDPHGRRVRVRLQRPDGSGEETEALLQ